MSCWMRSILAGSTSDPENALTLTLDIIDGRLSRLDLAEPEEESTGELPTLQRWPRRKELRLRIDGNNLLAPSL